jgi:hypothetical protein
MFTKKFNNLSDSLIEAAAQTLSKPIVNEASNETPTINHLELSEEELNELSPAALQKYKDASRASMRNPNVGGKELQKRQKGYSTAAKKLSGDANVRAKESEKKPESSFGVKVGKVTPKTPTQTPYKSTYSFIKEPVDRSKGYGTSMPQKAAASPMKEEEANSKDMPPRPRSGDTTLVTPIKPPLAPRPPHKNTPSSQKDHNQTSTVTSPAPHKNTPSSQKDHNQTREEELVGNQHKIDANKNGKIDADDFKKLRGEKSISESMRFHLRELIKLNEAKRRGTKDSGDDEEGPHYDEREDPETGEITRVKDTVPPKKHIMNQLRQAAQSMKKEHPVTYADGKTHMVPKHVAKALVNAYQDPSKKPYEKEAMQDEIGKSHKALMQHHSKINEDAYQPKPNGKEMLLEPGAAEKSKNGLDEVPVETMKQVQMINQEKEPDEEPPFEPTGKVNWKDSKQSRAKWLAKAAMEKMKKKSMKEEENVKPGAQYAKKVSVPEEASKKPMSHQAQTTMKHIENPTSGEIAAAKNIKPGVEGYRDRIDMLKSAQQRNEEVESIDERHMTDAEEKRRERIVKALKNKKGEFEKRYGPRAKDVMYAIATKQAMKTMKTEETPSGPKDGDGVKINPAMSTKEGIGVKSTTT